MLQHQLAIAAVRDYQKILRGDHRTEPLERVSDEGLSGSQNVLELLGAALSAQGPEPGPHAPCHDDAIGID